MSRNFLPKITPPELHNAIRRQDLFASLDSVQAVPIVWLTGLPGAGKTTAIASYLSERNSKNAWLRLDEGDSDPATLFYYLGLAIQSAVPRLKLRFPNFAPENAQNVSAFARIFFRYLPTRLTAPIKIVLDDASYVNEILLTQVLTVAAAELPRIVQIIVISRESSPPSHAVLLAREQLQLINPEQLRFTQEEVALFFGRSNRLDASVLDAIQQQTQGWAAGLLLLREGQRWSGGALSIGLIGYERVFEYFAVEVFEHFDFNLKHLLLRTAYLPLIPLSAAHILSSNPQAGQLLDMLSRRNLFTQCKQSKLPVYEYHSLFRKFLQMRANSAFSSQECTSLRIRSAFLLRDSGYVDEAIELLLQAEAWDEAAALILEQAPSLARHGRHQILCRWLLALPENVRKVIPALSLWLGEVFLDINDMESRRYLEEAHDGFSANGDVKGQLLAASIALEAMQLDYASYKNLAKWTAIVESLYEHNLSLLTATEELRIVTGRILPSVLSGNVQDIKTLPVERLLLLLDEDIDVNRRIGAATILLYYYYLRSDLDAGLRLITKINLQLKTPGVNNLRRCRWLGYAGFFQFYVEERYNTAETSLIRAEQLARELGLFPLLGEILVYRAGFALKLNEQVKAEKLLNEAGDLLQMSKPVSMASYQYISAQYALTQGKIIEAKAHAQLALEACERVECPSPIKLTYGLIYVVALLELGEYATAREVLIDTEDEAFTRGVAAKCACQLAHAYIAFKTGLPAEARQILQTSLATARAGAVANFYSFTPNILRVLYEAALAQGIETNYISRLAARNKLILPWPEWEDWSWTAKIRCLGNLEISVNDLPVLLSESKGSSKPIELLEAILAYGGRNAPVDELVALLWPGEGRVGGQKVLDITVHRLRKLLGNDALLVKKGRLEINAQIVWVDLWAIEAIVEKLEANRNLTLEVLEEAMPGILTLYRGHLLEKSPHSLRLISPLEALWGKVRRYLLRFGQLRTQARDLNGAAEVYRFGVSRDPLGYEFYYALMQTLIHNHQSEEAKKVYASCEESFQILLGKPPAPELRALLQTATSR